eukprot:gene10773-7500_t
MRRESMKWLRQVARCNPDPDEQSRIDDSTTAPSAVLVFSSPHLWNSNSLCYNCNPCYELGLLQKDIRHSKQRNYNGAKTRRAPRPLLGGPSQGGGRSAPVSSGGGSPPAPGSVDGGRGAGNGAAAEAAGRNPGHVSIKESFTGCPQGLSKEFGQNIKLNTYPC